jgi:hypothetical protein
MRNQVGNIADRELARELSGIAAVTCQICAREIEANTGVIAHHGYQRPQYGSGWQTASCMGARHLPYEVACNLLPDAITAVKAWVKRCNATVKLLKGTPELKNPAHESWAHAQAKGYARLDNTEPPKTIVYVGEADWSNYATMTAEEKERNSKAVAYGNALSSARHAADMELQSAKEELARLEQRLADWHLVTLDEQRKKAAKIAQAKLTPAPGTRAAKIAENKAKAEAKAAAVAASMLLPCAHGKNPSTCKVHGHSIFLNGPGSRNPMTMCGNKEDYLANTARNNARKAKG